MTPRDRLAALGIEPEAIDRILGTSTATPLPLNPIDARRQAHDDEVTELAESREGAAA
ncbi:MAG: hypothetical protein U1F25_05095 [Rubrivivax sp.]